MLSLCKIQQRWHSNLNQKQITKDRKHAIRQTSTKMNLCIAKDLLLCLWHYTIVCPFVLHYFSFSSRVANKRWETYKRRCDELLQVFGLPYQEKEHEHNYQCAHINKYNVITVYWFQSWTMWSGRFHVWTNRTNRIMYKPKHTIAIVFSNIIGYLFIYIQE